MSELPKFYRAQESAFAPGVVTNWPKVWRMPRRVPHGRLVAVSVEEVIEELREHGYIISGPVLFISVEPALTENPFEYLTNPPRMPVEDAAREAPADNSGKLIRQLEKLIDELHRHAEAVDDNAAWHIAFKMAGWLTLARPYLRAALLVQPEGT